MRATSPHFHCVFGIQIVHTTIIIIIIIKYTTKRKNGKRTESQQNGMHLEKTNYKILIFSVVIVGAVEIPHLFGVFVMLWFLSVAIEWAMSNEHWAYLFIWNNFHERKPFMNETNELTHRPHPTDICLWLAQNDAS